MKKEYNNLTKNDIHTQDTVTYLKEKEILNKVLIEKNLIDSWINDKNNEEEYLKILKQVELKLIEKGNIVKDYRIRVEARKIIKNNVLKLK